MRRRSEVESLPSWVADGGTGLLDKRSLFVSTTGKRASASTTVILLLVVLTVMGTTLLSQPNDIHAAHSGTLSDSIIPRAWTPEAAKCHQLDLSTAALQAERFISAGVKGAFSFRMNIHDPKEDHFISSSIAETGCFECDILKPAVAALESHAESILIDMGGNIGLYSLSAASLGHRAFVFEPAQKNWNRICRSIHANRGFSDRVTLFNVALSESPSTVRLNMDMAHGNFGAFQVEQKGLRLEEESVASLKEGTDYIQSIPLDDLEAHLPVDAPVVLKVDVEGEECNALGGAMKYLNKVRILYATIEWSQARLRKCSQRAQIFALFAKNNLKPYQRTGDGWKELDPKNVDSWVQGGKFPVVGLFDVAWSKSIPTDLMIPGSLR